MAGLDGDGLHEVLANVKGTLYVLDASGSTLTSYRFDSGNSSSWKNQPIVADIDGDGLAEIVVAGDDVVVLESPEGGWLIPDAEYDWPATDRHPGDRTASGGLPGPDPFWLQPGQNVWQGLSVGVPTPTELRVAITDVCVESCDGDAVVTVRADNPSGEEVSRDVTVTLDGIDRAEALGSTTIAAPFASGTARYVTFRIPADRVAEGLRATVDGEARVLECDETDNTDEYRDSPCP